MKQTLTVDELEFDVRRSARRESLGITVDRDGSLILRLPDSTPLQEAEAFAREKRFWIYTKLAEKDMLFRPRREREYVSGEGFYYLGRSYRLKVIDSKQQKTAVPPLRFYQGRFYLRSDARQNADDHFKQWYIEHGTPKIQEIANRYHERLEVEPHSVTARSLGYRWGSCKPEGQVYIHWKSVLLPYRILEYVVVHELVHLHNQHHDDEFWRRMERAMPDYRERKQWLAEHGAEYS